MSSDRPRTALDAHAPGERRLTPWIGDRCHIAVEGGCRQVANGLPHAHMAQQTGLLALGLPQVEGVAAPATHVRLDRERECFVDESRLMDADKEQATAALRNAVVGGEEDLLADLVAELLEFPEDGVAELALFPVGHARHVLQQERSGLQVLDDREHLLPEVVARVALAYPAVLAAGRAERLAARPADHDIDLAAGAPGDLLDGHSLEREALGPHVRVVALVRLDTVRVLVERVADRVASVDETLAEAACTAEEVDRAKRM